MICQKCLRLAFYSSMTSGYFHFGNSHFFFSQLPFLEIFSMCLLIAGITILKKLWLGFLCTPNVFVFCTAFFCTKNTVKSQDKIFL